MPGTPFAHLMTGTPFPIVGAESWALRRPVSAPRDEAEFESVSKGKAIASITTLAVLATAVAVLARPESVSVPAQPITAGPVRPRPSVDHSAFFSAPLADGPSVTRACLECHPEAASDVMATSHWSWGAMTVRAEDGSVSHRMGKRNLINNFCISVAANWERCTSCHAGYGWKDAGFDFDDEARVDCLVCHDTTGTYFKEPAGAGHPVSGVDLAAVARQVGRPSRRNCGVCHFNGGGGDAVKHGDMDASMVHPTHRIDVHMGELGFVCQDCHRTHRHVIPGAAMSISTDRLERVRCTDCHARRPHDDSRLDAHTHAVACQTCHIPAMAVDAPTKMSWDWSQAGKDPAELRRDNPDLFDEFLASWSPPTAVREADDFARVSTERFSRWLADRHLYQRPKGLFTFAKNATPEYSWYNGRSTRYLTGQPIAPEEVTVLARPLGHIRDEEAQIHPFKVHRGRQPYDRRSRVLLTPKTYGPGGYWTDYDWDLALRLGCEASGLEYSGEYGFAETEMYWPLAHMVAPKERALGCDDCHGPGGRMDWEGLGYDGDPLFQGTRLLSKMPAECETPPQR